MPIRGDRLVSHDTETIRRTPRRLEASGQAAGGCVMAALPLETDPRELRKHIKEVSRSGERIDADHAKGFAAHGSLARNVLMMCEYKGYSGEDAMTVLAYALMVDNQWLFDMLLEQANLSTARPIIVRTEPPHDLG